MRSAIAAMTWGTHCPPPRVERGLPGGRLGAAGAGFGERRSHHLARAVAPPGGAGVGSEYDRPHHGVPQSLAVAVGVVGGAGKVALAVLGVADEGDPLVGPGAERGAGEVEPAGGALERLAGCLTPGQP